ncbi:hypothetical protein AOLI_G00072820 [Acnodon oligacanthus]
MSTTEELSFIHIRLNALLTASGHRDIREQRTKEALKQERKADGEARNQLDSSDRRTVTATDFFSNKLKITLEAKENVSSYNRIGL